MRLIGRLRSADRVLRQWRFDGGIGGNDPRIWVCPQVAQLFIREYMLHKSCKLTTIKLLLYIHLESLPPDLC